MIRSLTLLYAFVACLLLLTGCYGRKLVNVPNTVDQNRAQIEQLRQNQDEILRLLREFDERLERTDTLVRELRADAGSQFAELREGIQVIEGKADDSEYRFSKLSEKVDEVKYSSAARADTLQAGTGSDSTAMTFDDARKAYRDAYMDVNAGNYDLAMMGFEEFLRNFPDSELSDNAQYWIGECFYATGRYEEAHGAFTKVLEDYPEGDKVPSALLKAAYCSLALGREEEGVGFLNELISRFPLSEEASLAQERLEGLYR
ncbi:MAG: tol-pal system protein YbgF [Candidatus Eiseniibacteriota bacterium]|nr:MAG: tol-pal system protein YbgF [Candidatus Eisenbacteria bacterium]